MRHLNNYCVFETFDPFDGDAPFVISVQALNVVLTHTTADFDTLAAAVGLAKLWQDERPDDGKTSERTRGKKRNPY